MTILRDNTTIRDLQQFARRRARYSRGGPKGAVDRTRHALQQLGDLLGQDQHEPHQAATLIGRILTETLVGANSLGLDPAGCLTLAQLSERNSDGAEEGI
jgi:hypothetical protein